MFTIIDYLDKENVHSIVNHNCITILFNTRREAIQYAYKNLSHDNWMAIRIS